MHKVGTRVVAISHSDDDNVYLFGYGVYEGRFLPPYIDVEKEIADVKIEYQELRKEDPSLPEQMDDEKLRTVIDEMFSNPRIKLDSGQTVWGYECWWGDIAGFQANNKRTIVEIDIDEARVKARNAEN